MKCTTAKKFISDYIDGVLEAEKRESLELHLGFCAHCHKLLKDFQNIAAGAKKLETFEPPARTWFQIQQQIKAQQRTLQAPVPGRRMSLRFAFGTVAVLAVMIGAVLLGLRYFSSQRGLPISKNGEYALAKLKEAELHYQQAIKALWEAASVQEKNLDPQVLSVFRKNLEIIDASIAACRQVVLDDPDNIEVRNELLVVYKEKADLLSEMATGSGDVSPGTETRKST